jgi:hypothetical protein
MIKIGISLQNISDYAFSAAGHELTWFRTLSQIQGAWLRHALFAVAAPSVGCAFAFREKSDKI